MPPQERLGLNDDERLFPGPHHACQQDQEHPVFPGTSRPFHLSTENDHLLTEERIFCHQLGLASGKVGQRPQKQRGGVWCGPGDEAMVERLKTQACQPRDEGEYSFHSIHSPW